MRDKWYGDARDLVKWGSLLALAEQLEIKHILQILYHRPTEWPPIELDGESVPLPETVIGHFRDCGSVVNLTEVVAIELLESKLESRTDYQRLIAEKIRTRPRALRPGIVLLDPDTGLEPTTPSLNHVLEVELQAIWEELAAGDLLAVYQHRTNYNGRPWICTKREQMECALGLSQGAVKVAKSPKIAHDVVLFYVRKSANSNLERPRRREQPAGAYREGWL